jgi:hypothetical protein
MILVLLMTAACGGGSGPSSTSPSSSTSTSMEPGRTAMTISYQRSGGRGDPPERETLTIDDGDGSFTMRRAVGSPSVGRFAGTVPDELLARVREEASGAAAEPAPSGAQMPDAPRELIDLGKGPLTVVRSTGGHLGELRIVLGEALVALLDQPEAAVRLVVAADGSGAELVHEGAEPVELDLSATTITAVLSSEAWEQKGSWKAGPVSVGGGKVTASSGWRIALPYDAGFSAAPGDHLVVEVKASIVDGPVTIPVRWAVD